MRNKADPTITQEISERFVELIENHLGITWSEVEHVLGYKNRTTLDAIRKGRTLPGPDKLFFIARYVTCDGKRANIDWLFSNCGSPLILAAETDFTPPLHQPSPPHIKTLNVECQIAVFSLVDLVQRSTKQP